MISRRRTVMRVIYRVFLALLGLVAAVLQAIRQAKPHAVSGGWEFAALVTLGALTFLDNTRVLVRRQSQAKLSESRRKVFRDVVAALSLLAETQPTSIMHLGASIFLVKRRVVWVGFRSGNGWPWRRPPALIRWDRYRLSDHPQASKVRWVVGKGAVGTAWATAKAAHRDWSAINARWASKSPTQAQFGAMKAETKNGLDYKEFVTLLGKYSETLAVPVVDDGGNVFGVLSVDVACTGNVPTMLAHRDVEKLLENTVGLVRAELHKR